MTSQDFVNLATKCGCYPGIKAQPSIQEDLFSWVDNQIALFLAKQDFRLKHKK